MPGKHGAMPVDAEQFQASLAQSGSDYLLTEIAADGQSARFRFTGRFHNRLVVWDCTLRTLESALTLSRVKPGRARCYIEIGEAGRQGMPLEVGLDIARIDTPAILKTIIMIRQYRHLRAGRHEFGGVD